MTTPTKPRPTKPRIELAARTLVRIARDRGRDDNDRILAAILADAKTNDERIDPNRVRVTLTNGSGLLDVWPSRIGRTYGALLTSGVIVPNGWTLNTDRRSGNAGKPIHLYQLRTAKP